jgi:multiple sugar transport system substrate-binding protein
MQQEGTSSPTGSADPGRAQVNRRRFLAVGGGAAAAAFLAACSSNSSGSGTTSAPATTSAGGAGSATTSAAATSASLTGSSASGSATASTGSSGATGGSATATSIAPADLTVWGTTAMIPDQNSALVQSGKAYAAKFGGSVTFQGFAAKDLTTKITTALAGGSGPDVVLFDISSVAQLAAAQQIVDITDRFASIKDQFFAGGVAAGQYQGKQYAVPYSVNNVALFWNKELFAKAGIAAPPTNWDDLLSAAKELTGGGNYGYMLGASGYGSFLFWPWLWQNGGAIANADNTAITVNSPEGLEAWDFYANLYLKNNVAPPTFLTVTQSWDQFIAPFMQGKCAMMPIGPWGIAPLKAGNPNLQYGIAPLPKKKQSGSVLGGSSLAVTSVSKHVDSAYGLIAWLASADQEKVLDSYQLIPGRVDAVNSSSITGNPALETFVQQAPAAQTRPTVPNWGDIEWGVMADAWDSVIHKQKGPEDALNAAATAATAKLKG